MTHIRAAQKSDASYIAQAQVSTWKTLYAGLIDQSYLDSLSVEERTSAWEEIISHEKNITKILEDNGEPVGVMSCGACRDDDLDPSTTGELKALYVDTSNQCTGHGRTLFLEARKALTEVGFKEMALWVLDTDVSARSFYEAMGLKCDGAAQFDDSYGVNLVTEVRYIGEIQVHGTPRAVTTHT